MLRKAARGRYSAVRNFYKFLDRRGILHNAAIGTVRSPKLPKSLPRPLTEKDAGRLLIESENTEESWLGLRDRALFTLLYGGGLRISEALGLTQSAIGKDAMLRVTGKGNKQRLVPLLPIIATAIEAYVAACPYRIGKDAPLFLGAKGEGLNPRRCPAPHARTAPPVATAGNRNAPRATAQFCQPPAGEWRRAARDPGIAGPCQPGRRRSATPKSTPNG